VEVTLDLIRLFADNLLPVFLCAAAGYALAATLRPEPRAVSHVAFFLFAPCLVFQLITENHLAGGDLLRMVSFALVVLLLLAAIAGALARAFGWPRAVVSAVALVVLLPNAGNFGLSVNLLAFGEEGLAHASIFFVSSAVLTFSVGVVVASLGRTGLGAAFAGMWRVPAIWAVLAAVVMLQLDWQLPSPLTRSVNLLAQGTIPLFLVILGMQLRVTGLKRPEAPLALAVIMRLVGGAILALVLVRLFGFAGASRQAAVLQASMPSAVICTILSTEYDVEPGLVTSVVFYSTLLSPLTLTPLLAYLTA
jgi:predicted permease